MNPGSDALQKMISENGEAVIYALDATHLVQESMSRVGCFPPATKHLGQAMMAAVLLQALTEKDGEQVSLQWMCDGDFGHLYAEARNYGEVRGTISRPKAPILDFETPLGSGILQVNRKRGKLSTNGIVNSTGHVSDDIVEYLERSEQKNCGVNFSVQMAWDDESNSKIRVDRALAYLVHILPQNSEQKLNDALVRWDRQMRSLGNISRWHLREEQRTLDMLRLISGEEDPKVVMNQRVVFSCNCSEERASRALTILETQEEKEGLSPPKHATEIRCEYCGKTYLLSSAKDPQ